MMKMNMERESPEQVPRYGVVDDAGAAAQCGTYTILDSASGDEFTSCTEFSSSQSSGELLPKNVTIPQPTLHQGEESPKRGGPLHVQFICFPKCDQRSALPRFTALPSRMATYARSDSDSDFIRISQSPPRRQRQIARLMGCTASMIPCPKPLRESSVQVNSRVVETCTQVVRQAAEAAIQTAPAKTTSVNVQTCKRDVKEKATGFSRIASLVASSDSMNSAIRGHSISEGCLSHNVLRSSAKLTASEHKANESKQQQGSQACCKSARYAGIRKLTEASNASKSIEGSPFSESAVRSYIGTSARGSAVDSLTRDSEITKTVGANSSSRPVSRRLDFRLKAQSRVGSLQNLPHKPSGGNVKIHNKKLTFKENAKSKVGSLENVTHRPGGGSTQIKYQVVMARPDLFPEKSRVRQTPVISPRCSTDTMSSSIRIASQQVSRDSSAGIRADVALTQASVQDSNPVRSDRAISNSRTRSICW